MKPSGLGSKGKQAEVSIRKKQSMSVRLAGHMGGARLLDREAFSGP